MLRKLKILLLFLTANAGLKAQDTINPMSLEEVLLEIRASNPALLSYNDRIRAMEAYAEGSGALDAPQISAGVFMTPYSLEKGMGSFMISGQQMIMNPAKFRAERKVMEQMPALEAEMQEEEARMLFEDAAKMYFEWLTLEKKLEILEESQQLLQVMISSAEISYKYNQTQLARTYQARAELFKLNDMEIMLEKEIAMIRIALNTLMNREKQAPLQIDTTLVIPKVEEFSSDSARLANRSDFRLLEEHIRLLDLQTSLQKAASKPDFGIRYDHMSGFGAQPNTFTAMGMISIPFAPWASKSYKAKIEGYRFEREALRKRQETIINRELGNLARLRTEAETLEMRMENYQNRILPALKNNYEASLLAFEKRQEDLFMVLEALMAYNMTRIEYLDLVNELLKLKAEYERVVETTM